ncbi:hypothetical protein QBC34DRAFT_456982 [Podospora aff. communis PSN243]|uniref:Protein kinase domain-containing protein n=1 Tax=Podospora aff. communis PSN243 TaxID=3040156 RepID=A0AAV9GWC3_9PEZI|nr:hypothetical protein QBC34DRAFT_456982 [Podospora aff. communis PSN243]
MPARRLMMSLPQYFTVVITTFRDADTLRFLDIALEHDDGDDGRYGPDELLALFTPRMLAKLAPDIHGVHLSPSRKILLTYTRYVMNKLSCLLRRTFRQKWLHELMGAVDFLNLQHGILHNDIVPQNIFINTETNSLVLLDLGAATQTTTWRTDGRSWGQGMSPTEGMQVVAQNDFSHAFMAVTNHVVRDPSLCPRTMDERSEIGSRLKNREFWVRHANVELDVDILALYDALMTWYKARKDGPLPCDAPQPISWPPNAPNPPETERDRRLSLSQLGAPPVSQLDSDRPILATGRYADVESETKLITIADLSRGFPQRLAEKA